ncbi:MAG: MFS transporter [Thiohalomonadaceae bacterium]
MLSHLFRSLRHRQFRLFYFGQLISITGTWMQNMAQAWLVYRLSHSTLMLGAVAFAAMLPVLLFGLAGGMLADRLPRRSLLITAQFVAMVQALLLALLVFSGQVQTWHVVILACVLGLVHAVEMPSRHSFLAELVPATDLPNAIALNSSIFNLARFAGPAIAGGLVATWGEGPVFLLNALSFLAVLWGLRHLSAGRNPATEAAQSQWRRLREGLEYAWNNRPIRMALFLLTAGSLTAPAYTVLMPVFAHQVYAGGAGQLGLLLGTAGIGALLAAMRLAWLGGRQHLSHNIAFAALAAGIGMLLFASSTTLAYALPLLIVLGFSVTTMATSINTLIQMQVPNQLRGRIMALFAVLFIGITSLGNLLAGYTATHLGVVTTVMLAGVICAGAGAAYRLTQVRMEERD